MNQPEPERPWWWLTLIPGDKIRLSLHNKPTKQKVTVTIGILAIRKVYVNACGSIHKIDEIGFEHVNWKQISFLCKPAEDFLITSDNIFVPFSIIKRIVKVN